MAAKDPTLRYFNDGELRKIGTRYESYEDSSAAKWSGMYDGVQYDTIADLSSTSAATINSLRQAFQIQKLYERDARGGTR